MASYTDQHSVENRDTQRLCPACRQATSELKCPIDGSPTLNVQAVEGRRDRLIGVRLDDRFELVRGEDRAGLGQTWIARDLEVGRDVTIKLFDPSLLRSEDDVGRFLLSAQRGETLKHPNTARTEAIGHCEYGAYVAVEHLAGETLEKRMARRGRLDSSDAARIAADVAGSLAEAHGAGQIHQALNPASVFLARGSTEWTKVLDYGIAGWARGQGQAIDRALGVGQAVILGDASHMAPEVLRGEAPSVRSDLYALGAIVYRAVIGRGPFEAAGQQAVRAPTMEDVAPELPADVPAPMRQLVAALLATNPALRPASAAAVADSLADIAAGRTAAVSAPAPGSAPASAVTVPSVTAHVYAPALPVAALPVAAPRVAAPSVAAAPVATPPVATPPVATPMVEVLALISSTPTDSGPKRTASGQIFPDPDKLRRDEAHEVERLRKLAAADQRAEDVRRKASVARIRQRPPTSDGPARTSSGQTLAGFQPIRFTSLSEQEEAEVVASTTAIVVAPSLVEGMTSSQPVVVHPRGVVPPAPPVQKQLETAAVPVREHSQPPIEDVEVVESFELPPEAEGWVGPVIVQPRTVSAPPRSASPIPDRPGEFMPATPPVVPRRAPSVEPQPRYQAPPPPPVRDQPRELPEPPEPIPPGPAGRFFRIMIPLVAGIASVIGGLVYTNMTPYQAQLHPGTLEIVSDPAEAVVTHSISGRFVGKTPLTIYGWDGTPAMFRVEKTGHTQQTVEEHFPNAGETARVSLRLWPVPQVLLASEPLSAQVTWVQRNIELGKTPLRWPVPGDITDKVTLRFTVEGFEPHDVELRDVDLRAQETVWVDFSALQPKIDPPQD